MAEAAPRGSNKGRVIILFCFLVVFSLVGFYGNIHKTSPSLKSLVSTFESTIETKKVNASPPSHDSAVVAAQESITAVADSVSSALSSWIPSSLSSSTPDVVENTTQSEKDPVTPSAYAYAFVIGGCKPEEKMPNHRGYVWNILISTKSLRDMGSTQDVVALFQISDTSPNSTLSDVDTRPLEALGVKIQYISKPEQGFDDFYGTQMRKFDILNLTQYRRVMFLDGDLTPLVNMDYLFELSDGPDAILKENVVVADPNCPSHGGFFMLETGADRYRELQDIIRVREENFAGENMLDGKHMFDTVRGWGHPFEPPDEWRAGNPQKHGNKWDYMFAYADPGLLHHYTKYSRKSVSMIYGPRGEKVENWGSYENGTVRLENILHRPFTNYSDIGKRVPCFQLKFYCDFNHFTSTSKPWLHDPDPRPHIPWDEQKRQGIKGGPSAFWWSTLRQLNDELLLGLNFTAGGWEKPEKSHMGSWPVFAFMNKRVVRAKQRLAEREKQASPTSSRRRRLRQHHHRGV
eukprot:CAMPEP_0172453562 /NCGR_PEP_ID=MMETSP1065-20121228/10821_1 /TAXON_ID=265537 /ORGANISM="Amphiprora paludosa, Strain CCMP125" /LENGTH=517 /DNA_ID=CAMNT_0013205745 /DNA_START=29 /DNA_END=1582 /DNA_ORIENTATION=-